MEKEKKGIRWGQESESIGLRTDVGGKGGGRRGKVNRKTTEE